MSVSRITALLLEFPSSRVSSSAFIVSTLSTMNWNALLNTGVTVLSFSFNSAKTIERSFLFFSGEALV